MEPNAHPIEELFRLMQLVEPFPNQVFPFEGRIPGLAFFPGGSGLWGAQAGKPLPPFPFHGVMVVGHNFDSVTGYQTSLARGHESSQSPTWKPLLGLLSSVSIHPSDCFFTNAYIGLKGGKATGDFPGAKDPAFKKRCIEFLAKQIELTRPGLILTLGQVVPPMLAELSADLPQWRPGGGLDALDARSSGWVRAVSFRNGVGPIPVVAITHPCNRHLNVGKRRFEALAGDAAEVQLVRRALEAAPLRVQLPRP